MDKSMKVVDVHIRLDRESRKANIIFPFLLVARCAKKKQRERDKYINK